MKFKEMAIFHLHHHQEQWLYYFKLFTISLPLFCLLSWASSTTTITRLPPQSAQAASRSLETRGYSVFAALITATATTDSWNGTGTGTVLAPPDFAFSSAAAKLNPHSSASLLLHHTLKEPLTWQTLSSRDHGHPLPTWQSNRCVFLSKGLNGNLGISPRNQHSSTIVAVKIRLPDLYVDDHLTVHGIDGVLDPTSLSTCSSPDQTVHNESQIDRSFLDHAIRALKRRGFGVIATAMAIKHSDLIRLPEITIFAPSDAILFSISDGFRFDFLHHVVPKRRHFSDIANLSAGTAIETLSPNKSVVVQSQNGGVTVNGVAVRSLAVYRNRWIVVLSVSKSIDDAISDSPLGESQVDEDEILGRSPAAEEEEATTKWGFSPGVSPAISSGGVLSLSLQSLGVEGEGLVCRPTLRSLRESGFGTGVYVERSSPSISYDEFSEKLVQSGPSRGFNSDSELVVVSGPSDENQTEIGAW